MYFVFSGRQRCLPGIPRLPLLVLSTTEARPARTIDLGSVDRVESHRERRDDLVLAVLVVEHSAGTCGMSVRTRRGRSSSLCGVACRRSSACHTRSRAQHSPKATTGRLLPSFSLTRAIWSLDMVVRAASRWWWGESAPAVLGLSLCSAVLVGVKRVPVRSSQCASLAARVTVVVCSTSILASSSIRWAATGSRHSPGKHWRAGPAVVGESGGLARHRRGPWKP